MIKKLKNLRITDKVIKIDHANPRPDIISEAALIIKSGGVISFPTRYLYGLGADAFNADAVDRVFKIKQRPYNKPLLVLVDKLKDLPRLVRNVPSVATHIMERFWPGEVTIVFEAKDSLPENLTGGTDRIGVRMPEHPVALALTNSVKGPITATSANITGQGGCSRVQDLDPLIADKLDLILDAGPLKGGIGSTVIDVTVDPLKFLREGAVSSKVILAALDRP